MTERKATATKARNDVELTWEDIAPRVDQALEELPQDLRVALVHHYLEGRSQTEIAAELGVGALDPAGPDVVELDVVDPRSLGTDVGLDVNAHAGAVAAGQVGDEHVVGARDHQAGGPAAAAAAVEDHLVPVAAGAADGDAIGADDRLRRQAVHPVGQQDGGPGLGLGDGLVQLVGRANADDGLGRRRQRRGPAGELQHGRDVGVLAAGCGCGIAHDGLLLRAARRGQAGSDQTCDGPGGHGARS